MDYNRVYFSIIERAKNRLLTEGYETHHITPKCMGGDNSFSNLVRLTYREHLLCHWILTKIHPNNKKLKYALYRLNNYHKKYPNSKTYSRVRIDFYKSVSKRMKENNPMAGKISPMRGKKHSKETVEKISESTKNLFKNEEYRKKHSQGVSKGISGQNHPFYGKTHKEESLIKAAKTKGCKSFEVLKDGVSIGIWWSQSQCCRDLNLKSVGNLNVCIKNGTAYGPYTFKYRPV